MCTGLGFLYEMRLWEWWSEGVTALCLGLFNPPPLLRNNALIYIGLCNEFGLGDNFELCDVNVYIFHPARTPSRCCLRLLLPQWAIFPGNEIPDVITRVTTARHHNCRETRKLQSKECIIIIMWANNTGPQKDRCNCNTQTREKAWRP